MNRFLSKGVLQSVVSSKKSVCGTGEEGSILSGVVRRGVIKGQEEGILREMEEEEKVDCRTVGWLIWFSRLERKIKPGEDHEK